MNSKLCGTEGNSSCGELSLVPVRGTASTKLLQAVRYTVLQYYTPLWYFQKQEELLFTISLQKPFYPIER